jgi:flagellar export protein FliJ
MARKPFSLQAVLDFKSSVLEIRELELAELIRRQMAETKRLVLLQDEATRELDEMRHAQQAKTLDIVDLQWRQRRRETLREQITAQQEVLHRIGEQVEAKREEVLVAHQEQEALIKLREREEQIQREEEKRREMNETDEITTARYFRRQST